VAEDTQHRLVAEDGRVLLDRVRFARSLRTRTRGLLGRTELDPGEALAFHERAVHMFFMRMALDVVFCDAELRVLKVAARLRPWRVSATFRGRVVLELGPGEAGRLGIAAGDRLRLEPPA
jgi:uncharacterized membrane protein (UPF0127 family)